ncbi:CidA/LrgA family protein [Microbulbifer echini]|uniref:CidA/LrgA family protein n=1 Tax=Microbulbifer echini TaxID=1529067 RepID=A0ABV4NP73_9GAMM
MKTPILRNVIQWLLGIATLLACECIGSLITDVLALPIPGSVVGMLLLLVGLMIYGGVPRGLAKVSSQLLFLLPLLFLPAATGVFFLRNLTLPDWFALLAAITVGTLISITLCALLLRRLLRKTGAAHDR